jgi:hypothetical protein
MWFIFCFKAAIAILMEQDSLLNQALNESKTLHQPGKISWYSNLTNVLNCFNIDKDISELSNLKSELKKQ